MKHRYVVFLAFVLFYASSFAQMDFNPPDNRKKEFENFKAKRIEYISSQMKLTKKEAAAFWPLCNELQEKKFFLHQALGHEIGRIKAAQKKGERISQKEYNRVITLKANTDVKEAQLDRVYLMKFKRILSPEKIFNYQKAERDFARAFFHGRQH